MSSVAGMLPPHASSGRGQRGRRVVLPERPRPEHMPQLWLTDWLLQSTAGKGLAKGDPKYCRHHSKIENSTTRISRKGADRLSPIRRFVLKRHSAQICELGEASSSASSFLINISLTLYITN